jgi:hypothetical protein
MGVSGAAVVVGGCAIAFPAAAVLFPIAVTLLAVAPLPPLTAGALVIMAAAMRGLALPWAATGLTLVGHVLLGFAAACAVRTRTGEPGAAAGAAVMLILTAPSFLPPVARWVSTFPAPGANGKSSDHVWWTFLPVCVAAIALSVKGRPLPQRPDGLPLTTYAVLFGAVGTGITMGRDVTS